MPSETSIAEKTPRDDEKTKTESSSTASIDGKSPRSLGDDITKVELAPTSTANPNDTFKRDFRFWMVFASLCCCTLLSALDLGGFGTAGPTIVHDLNGSDFTWVASAYALAASACIPLSGSLAQAFGRRVVMMAGIVMFGIGSAVCGSAHALTVLVVGRAIQGVGAGTIQALSSIIITDLVPLRERGVYAGITGMVYTLGSAIGPFIAGGLTQKATWRWLFYINLPLVGLAICVVGLFLHIKKPEGSIREKLARVDWLGNLMFMASTCSCMIGLTFGGVRFPWSSANVLAPLIIGIAGMIGTLFYEAYFPKNPVIPLTVLSNRTSCAGYVATFIQGMITLGITFYMPTWFQSVKLADPISSGLFFLPLAIVISPSAIAQGLIVSKTGSYRSVNLAGWVLTLLGVGLLITLKQSTSIGVIVVFELLMGVGFGLLYSITFPILAPLPLSANAPAVAFMTFFRQFSQAWGVAIGGTILQNALKTKLPPSLFLQSGVSDIDRGQLAYAIVPLIPTLQNPLQEQVRDAFVGAFRDVWIAFSICGAVGLLSLAAMKSYALKRNVDGKWGIDRDRKPAQKA